MDTSSARVLPAAESRADFFIAARGLVAPHMLDAAQEALASAQSSATSLIAQRRLPLKPWSEPQIELMLRQLSMMDSNNFGGHVGGGEREGRVVSHLVARRHFHMTHGIGRSGDITADQPKAAGSSLLSKLANALALDALRHRGLSAAESAIVVPLATGMALALAIQTVKSSRPASAKYVVWPRIDQKTCLKCIVAAGCVPYPVALRQASPPGRRRSSSIIVRRADAGACCDAETNRSGELPESVEAPPTTTSPGELMSWEVDAADVASAIETLGSDTIVCVLSTTSCFAPRLPDDTLAVSRVCEAHGVPLVVNNAYGLQSGYICRRLNAALQAGGVDYFVQSTDKNFLVPVGGSVIAGPKKKVKALAALYPGRASATASTDIFITLLELGTPGWQKLHTDREDLLYNVFLPALRQFADARREVCVAHARNDISFALTLRNYSHQKVKGGAAFLGAALFRHRVTGPKVIIPFDEETGARRVTQLCGCTFLSYGTHSDDSPEPLLVIACAVGMTVHDVHELFVRLNALYPPPP